MADEIQIEARKVEGTFNQVMPVATNVPVTHQGRRIGTAEVDQKGHIVMEIEDSYDRDGIWRMLANHEADSFSLGMPKKSG